MRSKKGQRFVSRHCQRRKFLAVLVMGRPLLRLLPEVCNRIVIWRIRRQRLHGDPSAVDVQKWLGGLARVILCPIMNEKQVLGGLGQNHRQKRLVTFGVEPPLDALREQAPREILNGAKHFIAFALATRGDLGLVPLLGPRVAQRAPRGKTGFIFKEDQTFAPLGRPEERWPCILKPGQALGRVEMVRDKTRLLKRKAQVVQQCTHIMTVVEDAKLAPDQHADEDGVPTGRLKANDERTGLDQLHQAFLVPRSQLWGAATTVTVDQAVHAAQQKGLLPGIETRRAESLSEKSSQVGTMGR